MVSNPKFFGTHNSCQTGCFKNRSFRSKLHRWFVVDKNSVIASGGKVTVHRALAIRLVGALFPTSTMLIAFCFVRLMDRWKMLWIEHYYALLFSVHKSLFDQE
jgi:hypothetical protein